MLSATKGTRCFHSLASRRCSDMLEQSLYLSLTNTQSSSSPTSTLAIQLWMKEGSLMRLLLRKIQFPFICFCNTSAAHLYTSAPLNLESSPHVVPSHNGKKKAQAVLKSCIRKPQDQESVKKNVQWVDYSGKQLAEIKDFESSETGDSENEEDGRRCLCIIL